MPQTLQKQKNLDGGENMVSNLPLLFAAGYPTSLDKITESQLEKFIPFMVQCSLGQIQIPNMADCSEPEWWPEDVAFSIPLRKSAQFAGALWLAKLKEIVAICYQFHKSVFLLRFCENLSVYQPENLRFINNLNSTTSLFDRISNKLLVTFRNENMRYDQIPMNPKKTLLPRTQSSQAIETNQESMVEQAPFDIYLCDNCEAELYSLEAYQEHERFCQGIESEDDDVIFCGEQELEPTMQKENFLLNFQLTAAGTSQEQQIGEKTSTSQYHNNNNNNFSINNNSVRDIPSVGDKAIKRVPRRSHVALTLSKCPTIPFSSPAGQHLIKTTNGQMRTDYHRERIERAERFCQAPIIDYDGTNRPKFLEKKLPANVPITFRKTNAPYRPYNVPRKQFTTKSREQAVKMHESILFKESGCRPLFISLIRLNDDDIAKILADLKSRNEYPPSAKIARRTKEIDFIDLCTSDEEEFDIDQIDDEASNEATTPDSNGTKENIDHDTWSIVQITKGSKSIDLNSLRKTFVNTVSLSNCDSTSSPDTIQNLLTNRQSISLIRNKPLQHQNQENNVYRYQNGNVRASADSLLFGKSAASNEITITRRPSTVSSTVQPNSNFESIDLTL